MGKEDFNKIFKNCSLYQSNSKKIVDSYSDKNKFYAEDFPLVTRNMSYIEYNDGGGYYICNICNNKMIGSDELLHDHLIKHVKNHDPIKLVKPKNPNEKKCQYCGEINFLNKIFCNSTCKEKQKEFRKKWFGVMD